MTKKNPATRHTGSSAPFPMREISFFINVEHPEIRVAEVRDGRLHDLEIERDSRLLGDIYLGQVQNIVPGMDAAFVDIGVGRNALIYVGDLVTPSPEKANALPIEKLLKAGQLIVVQVARPPVGTKGARVTAKLSVPGRYTVLAAGGDSVGISRRIDNAEERERLRRIAEKSRPLDHGIIVRTEAEGASSDDISSDIEFGKRQLESIKEKAASITKPALLHRDLGILGRLARDRMGDSIDRIIIDGREEYEAFRGLVEVLAPNFVDRVHLHTGSQPLFSHLNIARDIERAKERVVALPHGGSLVIDEAEALTAIDVNTGKFTGKHRLADTVLQTNLEAVEEAARQLRLRNIGGVIVIDFIDMERTRDRIKVMDTLEQALKGDRTRTRIVQLSPLGLVEMTRRREGDSLRRLIYHTCPYCEGDGLIESVQSVAIDARRRTRETLLAGDSAPEAAQVILHPNVATAFLGNEGEWASELEEATRAKVFLKVDFGYHLEKIVIERGSVAELEGSRGAVTLGQRIYLQPNALLHRDSAATFTVLQGMLIYIETKDGQTLKSAHPTPATESLQPAVIEIIKTGRWFHTARAITSLDPRDE